MPPRRTLALFHSAARPSSLNKREERTCGTHPSPALANVCNYANLRTRLPLETKYENVSIPDERATLQPGTTRKSSLTYQMGPGMARGRSHGHRPAANLARSPTTRRGARAFAHLRGTSQLPNKEKAAGNETAIGMEIRLQPRVKGSRSAVSATYGSVMQRTKRSRGIALLLTEVTARLFCSSQTTAGGSWQGVIP